MTEPLSPSQTIGPLWGFALMFEGSAQAVDPSEPGALRLYGNVSDGLGPLGYPDSLLEVWHGEQWARTRPDEDGNYAVVVRKPPPLELPDGAGVQAPHLNLCVFARGLLKQVITRVYFPDEAAANAADPVLALVDPDDRETLVGTYDADGGLRFDVRIQGDRETVFFAL